MSHTCIIHIGELGLEPRDKSLLEGIKLSGLIHLYGLQDPCYVIKYNTKIQLNINIIDKNTKSCIGFNSTSPSLDFDENTLFISALTARHVW